MCNFLITLVFMYFVDVCLPWPGRLPPGSNYLLYLSDPGLARGALWTSALDSSELTHTPLVHCGKNI